MRTKTNTRKRVKFSDIVEPPVASYSQHLLRRYIKRSQREREREREREELKVARS